MKRIATLLIAATLGLAGNAQADWGHHHFRPYAYGPRYDYRPAPRWVGPAAAIAITGAVIGATTYGYAHAAPVYSYSPPPRPIPVPVNVWYYCGSSGQYYPYTNACPEGWQAVPAR